MLTGKGVMGPDGKPVRLSREDLLREVEAWASDFGGKAGLLSTKSRLGQCRYCLMPVEWFVTTNGLSAPVLPGEYPTHRIHRDLRWHVSVGGLLERSSGGREWCLVLHTWVCPAKPDPGYPELVDMRRRLGVRARKLRDRLGLDPVLTGEAVLDAGRDGSLGAEVEVGTLPGLSFTEAEPDATRRTATTASVHVEALTLTVRCPDASVLDDRVYVALTRLPKGTRSQDGNSWTFPRIMVEASVRELAARYGWPWYDANQPSDLPAM